MLVVVLLLPLPPSMYDGEFNQGGGGGGGGSGGQRLAAKAAGIESIDGRMTACDYESRGRKTMQQPTNEGISKNGRWWVATMATQRRL